MANQPDEHKRSDDRPPVFNDQATRDKIDKHLSDPHDTISEEDIRNIHTEPHEHYMADRDENQEEKAVDDEKITESKEDGKKDDSAPIETPWNILGD